MEGTNELITLRKLRKLVASTIGKAAPGWKQLAKTEIPVAAYNDGKLSVMVYPGGFIAARCGRRHTVFRIEDCGAYTNCFCRRFHGGISRQHFDAESFMDQRWEIRTLMEAEDRLERNNNLYEFCNAARF